MSNELKQNPYAYACPAKCGCLWRDNKDNTLSLFGFKSNSCAVCEPMGPDTGLIPLWEGPRVQCSLPPPGWECSRKPGHEGPCAASRSPRVIERPGLSFDQLRNANMRRLPQFKNKYGELAHSKPDGSDWSPAQWLQATVGELGEYANLRKKYDRGDVTKEEFLTEAGHELADVVTYLDILAYQLGINLGEAVRTKFNVVSERVRADVTL